LTTSAVMNSPPGVLLGDQEPRICSLPLFDADRSGANAVLLAAAAGLDLDPWQRFVLEAGLRRRGGKWAAFEVALIVARQNGKGAILEALELAALFLFPDVRLILHSAHEFKTAAEAFLRIRHLIEGSPEFSSRVARIRTTTGAEAIELLDGTRLRFVARSSGSGESKIIHSPATGCASSRCAACPRPHFWNRNARPGFRNNCAGWGGKPASTAPAM